VLVDLRVSQTTMAEVVGQARKALEYVSAALTKLDRVSRGVALAPAKQA
jgi:hypothetical protein